MNLTKLKDYNTADTIASIATFPAKSALGIIKVSGSRAMAITSRIFSPAKKKDIRKARTYSLHYGWIINRGQRTEDRKQKRKEEIIDEALVSIMRKPHSYTCEDVVEISSHGGTLVLNKILELVLRQGARLALPGEFSYRAFLNGRIDLLQAQSILNIIDAGSEDFLSAASSQLQGKASFSLKELKEQVKDLFIKTEAAINFPEDDTQPNFSQIRKSLKGLDKKINRLLTDAQQTAILKDGLKCVICGKTNVGKSTFFNYLLKEERAIVSELAGTTRDVIEETVKIKGLPLRLYDTAGMLEPRNVIEEKAIEKSANIFNGANVIILMLDGSGALTQEDLFLLKKVKELTQPEKAHQKNKNVIILINKADLKQRIKFKEIANFSVPKLRISALSGAGIKDFEEEIFKISYRQMIKKEDIVFLGRYQLQLLKKISDSLSECVSFLNAGHSVDFVNFSLKESLDNLGKLSGEIVSADVLEDIFGDFCIGK